VIYLIYQKKKASKFCDFLLSFFEKLSFADKQKYLQELQKDIKRIRKGLSKECERGRGSS